MHPSPGGPHRQSEREEASQPDEGRARTAHPIIVGSGYVDEGAAMPVLIKKDSLEEEKHKYNMNNEL